MTCARCKDDPAPCLACEPIDERVRIGTVDVPLEVLELRAAMNEATARYKAALAELTPRQASAVCGFNQSQQRLRARHRAGEHRPYHASCELCRAEGRYPPGLGIGGDS